MFVVGVSMLNYLHKLGIACGYALINAVSHLMSKVLEKCIVFWLHSRPSL